MAVKVIIPTPLRAYAGKQESVELQAATVGEALVGADHKFASSRSICIPMTAGCAASSTST